MAASLTSWRLSSLRPSPSHSCSSSSLLPLPASALLRLAHAKTQSPYTWHCPPSRCPPPPPLFPFPSRTSPRPPSHLLAAVSVDAQTGPPSSQDGTEDDVTVDFPSSPLFVPYPERGPHSEVLLSVQPSPDQLGLALAEFIVQASKEAIARRGVFTIALSGGSLVQFLSTLSQEPWKRQVEWDKWQVLWVDERFVQHTSDDSNFKQAAVALLSKVPVLEEHILPTNDEITDLNEIAEDYEALLRELVEDNILTTTKGQPFPRLDLVLLGLGPEGHTASLFPNSPVLATRSRWVLPVPSAPKPPAQRITMTLPVINAARKVAFVVVGSSKAEVVQRVLERTALPGSLPAQLVRPYRGSLTWFLDSAAAARLSVSAWNDSKKFPFVQH